MDIITDRSQVTGSAGIYDNSLVAPTEQMAKEHMPAVVPGCVGAEEPFHTRDEVALRSFQDQMKMVGHEAKGVHLESRLLRRFAECFEEELPISNVSDDSLTMIAPAHDVIDSARILHTEFASHWPKGGSVQRELSILLTDPFTELT